jgi:hypothetical protein
MPRSPKCSIHINLSQETSCVFLTSPIRATFLAYLIFHDLVFIIIFCGQHKLWSYFFVRLLLPLSYHPLLKQSLPFTTKDEASSPTHTKQQNSRPTILVKNDDIPSILLIVANFIPCTIRVYDVQENILCQKK